VVKITAYDFTIYGGLEGVVETVSADSLVDQKKGEPYYVVRIRTEKSELTRYGKTYPIMPGMIASADIITGKKTVLASLLKPLEKAQSEALRER
jgi:adhesin transport system membrane fusion protein